MDTLTTPTELPPAKAVRDLLADLLGRDVEVAVSQAWAPTPADLATVAEFVDDRMQLRSVALLDLPLAVYSGAAIGLLPAGGAADMVDERDPSPAVLENLYEVLNVVASVFNNDVNAHVKIRTMHAPGAALPGDVEQLVRRLTQRLDLLVTIAGYGGGRLSLCVLR